MSLSALCGPVEAEAVRLQRQAYEAKRAATEREQKLAASLLPDILKDYAWSVEAMLAESADFSQFPVRRHWQALLCLFGDDDIVWIGRDRFDSGSPGHRWRFRPVTEWQGQRECPGILTCPSTFRPGVYQRFEEHILTPKFLVVESDSLTHDQFGAVLRWVEEAHQLPLRAVVDSGNRSLHGWFDYPAPPLLEKLRLWLPALGCDDAMFTPNQPCRLPGAWRPKTKRYQRLLYLA